MNVKIGGIYYCEKDEEIGVSSGHFWSPVYADDEKVLYVTLTSRIEKRKHHPAYIVFLDVNRITDDAGNSLFDRPTVLNCFYPPGKIAGTLFTVKIESGILRYKNALLPDYYLAQIIPCAASVNDAVPAEEGQWTKNIIKEVSDRRYGIGGKIDGFFDRCRK